MAEAEPVPGVRGVLRIGPFRRLWIGFGLSSLGDWVGLLAVTALAKAYAGEDYRAAPDPEAGSADDAPSFVRTIVEGWAFIGRTPLIRGMVAGICGASVAGAVVVAVGRSYVADLGAGDVAYGVLFGAVFGGLALGMAVAPRVLRGVARRRLFATGLVGAGVSLAALGLVQKLPLSTVVAVVLGACAGAAWISAYTLIGWEVPDEVRGRTFAFLQSLVRIVLAGTLAVTPFAAGVIGRHRIQLTEDTVLTYNGGSITMLCAGVLAAAIGVLSWREVDR